MSKHQIHFSASNAGKEKALSVLGNRYVKKGGELMGTDLVLLDGKVSISVHRLNTFEHMLKEGGLHEPSVYDVTRSNQSLRFADAPVAIRLIQ